MEISLKHTIKQVMPKLEQFTSRQAPFVIAKALTNTAQDVRKAYGAATPAVFDRPNAFTRGAWAMQPARKADLTAYVFAKDKQARYLKFQVQGGGRRIKGFEKRFGAIGEHGPDDALVPTRNVRLDASGGVSLATIKRMQQQMTGGGKVGRYFLGKPKGGGKNAGRGVGIYARVAGNKKLEALMVFASTPRYSKRFDMRGIGKRTINGVFEARLKDAWAYALRTAR